MLLLLLLKPDLVMIDHGHFQYNSLILGLILMGFYCLLKGNWYVVCLVYTIAIHAKQMAVYYALAFLAGLIGLTYHHYKHHPAKVFVELVKYGGIVLGVSLLIWCPWFSSL